MPAICTGPPGSDGCNKTPTTTAKSAVAAAVDAFRSFIVDFKNRTDTTEMPRNHVPSVRAEARNVNAAQQYMSARIEGRNEDVLHLVTDDIELLSSRDGKFSGKSQFRDYIHRVKPTGSWEPATWNSSIGKAEILGNVRILMLNVGVVAHFGFDRAGKINDIYVGSRRNAPEH